MPLSRVPWQREWLLVGLLAGVLWLAGCVEGIPGVVEDGTEQSKDNSAAQEPPQSPITQPSLNHSESPILAPLSFSDCRSWAAYVNWAGEALDPTVPPAWEAGTTLLDGVLTFIVKCDRIGLGSVEAQDAWLGFNAHSHFTQPESCSFLPEADFFVGSVWTDHARLADEWQAQLGGAPFVADLHWDQTAISNATHDSLAWEYAGGENRLEFRYSSIRSTEWHSNLALAWSAGEGIAIVAFDITDQLPETGYEPVIGSTSSPEVSASHGLTKWIGFPTVSLATQLEADVYRTEDYSCGG